MSQQTWRIIEGDSIEQMAAMPDASVDAIVTDPPYGLGFMGREWDALPPGLPWAQECLRVLKPGGHILAFGGTRTSHRLVCAIEDAGFEIRDSVLWLYGSGFPKSLDVSKAIDKAAGAEREVVGPSARHGGGIIGNGSSYELPPEPHMLTTPATPDAERWQGWGTALKPAHEPVTLARKPFSGTVVANVLEHGTGALNIDDCRIAGDVPKPGNVGPTRASGSNGIYGRDERLTRQAEWEPASGGRWPANVVLDPEAAAMLDEQTGERGGSGPASGPTLTGESSSVARGTFNGVDATPFYGDSGGASRFFYCAKADSAERNVGLDGFAPQSNPSTEYGTKRVNLTRKDGGENRVLPTRNAHPTVKPVELMRWLCRLITPPGGTVLDPFTGSGTTGIAAMREGFTFIGIERESEYVQIARARIVGDAPLLNSVAEAA